MLFLYFLFSDLSPNRLSGNILLPRATFILFNNKFGTLLCSSGVNQFLKVGS